MTNLFDDDPRRVHPLLLGFAADATAGPAVAVRGIFAHFWRPVALESLGVLHLLLHLPSRPGLMEADLLSAQVLAGWARLAPRLRPAQLARRCVEVHLQICEALGARLAPAQGGALGARLAWVLAALGGLSVPADWAWAPRWFSRYWSDHGKGITWNDAESDLLEGHVRDLCQRWQEPVSPTDALSQLAPGTVAGPLGDVVYTGLATDLLMTAIGLAILTGSAALPAPPPTVAPPAARRDEGVGGTARLLALSTRVQPIARRAAVAPRARTVQRAAGVPMEVASAAPRRPVHVGQLPEEQFASVASPRRPIGAGAPLESADPGPARPRRPIGAGGLAPQLAGPSETDPAPRRGGTPGGTGPGEAGPGAVSRGRARAYFRLPTALVASAINRMKYEGLHACRITLDGQAFGVTIDEGDLKIAGRRALDAQMAYAVTLEVVGGRCEAAP